MTNSFNKIFCFYLDLDISLGHIKTPYFEFLQQLFKQIVL